MAVLSIDLGRWDVRGSDRNRDFWKNALVRAFGLSITFHLCVFGLLEIGHHFGWWQQSLLADWFKPEARKLAELANQKNHDKTASLTEDAPTIYVQVEPSQATEEVPKEAKYYGANNSLAANPEPSKQAEVPRIDGQQTKVVKTTSVPRPVPLPLQPRPAEPEPLKETKAEELKARAEPKPQATLPSGDLTQAKPQPDPAENTQPVIAPPPRPRPRTLAQALAQPGRLVGEKMKQEGGVQRRAATPSLDVKGTLYGAYDEAIVEAISRRWFNLLDQNDYVRGRTGKVVLEFKMLHDGRIAEMNEVENTVGEFLGVICQMAVRDPAPYPPWPPELRRLVGSNARLVRFTFYYD